MSRVFRRPMFRKGGGANMNGIMSGITDREMHAESNEGGVGFTARSPEQILAEMPKNLTEQQDKGFDPLTTFLLQYGPAIASQPAQGKGLSGLISTGLAAAKGPLDTVLTEQADRRKYQRDIKAGLSELAIKQAGEERTLAEKIKAEGLLQSERLKADAAKTGNEIYDIYKGIRIEEAGGEVPEYVGDNFAFYNTEFRKKMRDNLPSEQIGGLLRYTVNPDDPRSVKEWEKKNKAKINAGQIYYYSEETGKPIVWNNKTKSFDKLSMDFSEVDTFDDNSVDTVGTGGEIEVLSFEDAKSLAGERGYVLIPPRPSDAGRGWLADQKRKNPNAITKSELEDIIEKEQFAERYKNIKGKKQRTR